MIFQFNKKQAFIILLIIFLSVQLIGLVTAIQFNKAVQTGEIEPVFKNPDSILNSIYLFAYILIMTVVLLLVIKFKKKLIYFIEAVSIFFSSWIVFDLIISYSIGYPIGIVFAMALTYWKMKRPTYLSQNIALIFAVAGAGAVIGSSFSVLPVMVFIFLLSCYDFFSVFISKHMIYLAKAITEKPTAFTAAIPTKTKKFTHTFQLGGGDLVIPLVFAVSVLNAHGLTSALFSLVGALIALILLFKFIMKKPGIALPALPPLAAGAFIGFALSLLL